MNSDDDTVVIQLRPPRRDVDAWRQLLEKSLSLLASARTEIALLRARLDATEGHER